MRKRLATELQVKDAASRQSDGRGILAFLPGEGDRRAEGVRGGAAHSLRPPGAQAFVAESHYATVFLTSPVRGSYTVNGSCTRVLEAAPGTLAILPAGSDATSVWHTPRDSMAVVITPESLAELAVHEFDSDGIELWAPPTLVIDPWAQNVAHLLRAEIALEKANELYIDSLITIFGLHLLRNYSNRAKPSLADKGGLSARNARNVRDYLAANFGNGISVADLATVCQISPSHFIQAFARTFGQRPHQYLTNLRLDRAVSMLAENENSIAQIAHQSGFSSQSHLTSALRKHRSLTPGQIRRGKLPQA